MNLQEFITKKQQAKVAKKATKQAKMEFFKDQKSTELWNQVQVQEPEFANLIRTKGLNTIHAIRYNEEVLEMECFMDLIHKSSIILGFDLTECSFFTEYDLADESVQDDYIIIPTWIDDIFDSNYGYYEQNKPSKLIADFTDVCNHEYRGYDQDPFWGQVVWNKELGVGMIFFTLEDDVNSDQISIIRTK